MEWSGFALLILVGVGIISTGLPAAFILIAVATLGAILGIATDTILFSLRRPPLGGLSFEPRHQDCSD
jgi:hypothetical protein